MLAMKKNSQYLVGVRVGMERVWIGFGVRLRLDSLE